MITLIKGIESRKGASVDSLQLERTADWSSLVLSLLGSFASNMVPSPSSCATDARCFCQTLPLLKKVCRRDFDWPVETVGNR